MSREHNALLRPEAVAPVCIAGMHRSGTSTVAQLLHRCGLYLGPEDELFAARADNPDGFWENRRLVAVNERILEAYGAGWDLPPRPVADLRRDKRLEPLRTEAQRLLREFEGRERWGWKDPRSSLTLPFWLDLLPETRVVVCLRNPLEVAHSLRRRGNSSRAFSMNLWTVYNRRLLDTVATGRYIVTHYEAYFYRPQSELRRLLDFLRLPASDQLVARARSTTLKDLRHHRSTTRQLREAGASPELLELYARLCEEADWDDERPLPWRGRLSVRGRAEPAW